MMLHLKLHLILLALSQWGRQFETAASLTVLGKVLEGSDYKREIDVAIPIHVNKITELKGSLLFEDEDEKATIKVDVNDSEWSSNKIIVNFN